MCAPQFDLIKVPTPIIINGIPFDEDLLDPLDIIPEFDAFEDFDDVSSDSFNLFISDSDSPTNYDQFQYPDFDESDDSNDEYYGENFDLQEALFDFLLVDHDVLRTYDETSALVYSRWIHENMADFPPELERFIAIQLGIIIDIAIQSAQPY